MSGDCGSCTLCCTLLGVDFDDGEYKEPMIPCQHLCGKGCGIYENRPEVCKGFECVWLASHRWADLKLPGALRPDRCGVVLEVNNVGVLIAHYKSDHVWKGAAVFKWLMFKAYNNNTVLIKLAGDKHNVYQLDSVGDMEKLVFMGVDPATKNNKYGKLVSIWPVASNELDNAYTTLTNMKADLWEVAPLSPVLAQLRDKITDLVEWIESEKEKLDG